MTQPIDFTTIEDAIWQWMTDATGIDVIWQNQGAPQPAYPYGSLLTIAGPGRIGGADERRTFQDLTVVKDVKITPVAQNSTTYDVTINGTLFQFASDASATVAEITAGLVSAINGGAEPVTATDNGTDLDLISDTVDTFTLVLDDDFDGTLLDFANNDAGHEVLTAITGPREMTVSAQIYVDKPEMLDPSVNAQHLMATAQAYLRKRSVLDKLSAAGLSVVNEGPIDNIDEVIEDSFVQRRNMDVIFGLTSTLDDERVGYVDKFKATSASLGLTDEVIGGS